MLRYQLKNTIYTPAMAAAILVQCFFMMVGLYPKANADMVYNLQQSMTLGYGWLFISVTSVVPLCFFLHFGGRRQEIYMAVSRSTYRTYVRASALNAVLSGMAVAVGACLLFTIICGIWSSDMTPSATVHLGSYRYRTLQRSAALDVLSAIPIHRPPVRPSPLQRKVSYHYSIYRR